MTDYTIMVRTKCEKCKGEGYITHARACTFCKSTGKVEKEMPISEFIRVAVDDEEERLLEEGADAAKALAEGGGLETPPDPGPGTVSP